MPTHLAEDYNARGVHLFRDKSPSEERLKAKLQSQGKQQHHPSRTQLWGSRLHRHGRVDHASTRAPNPCTDYPSRRLTTAYGKWIGC